MVLDKPTGPLRPRGRKGQAWRGTNDIQPSRHRDLRSVNGPAGQSPGTRKITNEPESTQLTCGFAVERVTGIESALSAWESVPSGPVTWPDLRGGVSASDRDRPLATAVNGPLMARPPWVHLRRSMPSVSSSLDDCPSPGCWHTAAAWAHRASSRRCVTGHRFSMFGLSADGLCAPGTESKGARSHAGKEEHGLG
jgi:hypothetical protein